MATVSGYPIHNADSRMVAAQILQFGSTMTPALANGATMQIGGG
jgi:hypothetical protein